MKIQTVLTVTQQFAYIGGSCDYRPAAGQEKSQLGGKTAVIERPAHQAARRIFAAPTIWGSSLATTCPALNAPAGTRFQSLRLTGRHSRTHIVSAEPDAPVPPAVKAHGKIIHEPCICHMHRARVCKYSFIITQAKLMSHFPVGLCRNAEKGIFTGRPENQRRHTGWHEACQRLDDTGDACGSPSEIRGNTEGD